MLWAMRPLLLVFYNPFITVRRAHTLILAFLNVERLGISYVQFMQIGIFILGEKLWDVITKYKTQEHELKFHIHPYMVWISLYHMYKLGILMKMYYHLFLQKGVSEYNVSFGLNVGWILTFMNNSQCNTIKRVTD